MSAFDHAFLYGDSIYETLRTERGHPAFLAQHLARLARSAELLGMTLPPGISRTVTAAVGRARARLRVPDVTVRIMLTRGAGEITPDPTKAGPGELLVYLRPFVPRPGQHYERGVSAVVARARKASPRSIPSAAKTGNFLPHVLATAEARRAGVEEALMLSVEGELAEGTTSNLFWFRGETLFTPHLRTGILPGITRRLVIELARNAGIRVAEVVARPRALRAAEEAFLTSSTAGVIPLVRVDGVAIGSGRVGERTQEIARLYRERVARECDGAPTAA